MTYIPLCYASMSATDNASATTISDAGVPVQIEAFDTNGPSLGLVPDHTEDHITVGRDSDYFIMVSATVNSGAGGANRFEMTVQKNDGDSVVGGLHVDRNMSGGGGESGSVSMSGIAALSEGDTIELWIENETNTVDYTIENINLTIMRVISIGAP